MQNAPQFWQNDLEQSRCLSVEICFNISPERIALQIFFSGENYLKRNFSGENHFLIKIMKELVNLFLEKTTSEQKHALREQVWTTFTTEQTLKKLLSRSFWRPSLLWRKQHYGNLSSKNFLTEVCLERSASEQIFLKFNHLLWLVTYSCLLYIIQLLLVFLACCFVSCKSSWCK